MHARDLVELAALAALHGASVISDDAPLAEVSLERYWTGSKCRLDRWGRVLKRLSEAHGSSLPDETRENAGALEEIVTGDVLARVWTAVLVGHDRRTGYDSGAIARTILVGQHEARNRALSLLVNGPGLNRKTAIHLNRLRRRAECWADLLVGYLSTVEDLSEFAAEPTRAREFSSDFREEGTHRWGLLLASLRASFATAFEFPSPNADLNGEIAAGVIAGFQPEIFDSTGLVRTLWLTRLQRTTAETQGMIDALFMDGIDPVDHRAAPVPSDSEFLRRRFGQ